MILVSGACSKNDPAPFTPAEQLAYDINVIDAYIQEKGITNVIKDPSGLRYVIHEQGTGPMADLSCQLKLRYYIFSLPDEGFIYRSSEPPTYFAMPATSFIEGLQIAIKYIHQGSKVTLFIPSGLAYGTEGLQNSISPNEPIAFYFEFIDFFREGTSAYDGNDHGYQALLVRDVWLGRDLKADKFLNGDPISSSEWSLNEYFDANLGGSVSYGNLYSYAAVTDERKICPSGYRLPSLEEFQSLSITSVSNVINLEYGGFRDDSGTITGQDEKGVYWTADSLPSLNDAMVFVIYKETALAIPSVVSKSVQASVRCIKD